jgi:ArsR family transcriptional regulator, lead/cadmium/zinc/bismuth-responsive transcriptional repressor
MTDRSTSQRAQGCGPHAAGRPHGPEVSDSAFERAAALFRAAGDLARLRLLHRLDAGECCVTELADASETKLATLSQQLRVLRAERMVKRRREGKHIYYSLADDHVRELIRTALDHAGEPAAVTSIPQGKKKS